MEDKDLKTNKGRWPDKIVCWFKGHEDRKVYANEIIRLHCLHCGRVTDGIPTGRAVARDAN